MKHNGTLSYHASRRSQQRGVPIHFIESVIAYYDLEAAIGDDCRVLRVSRAASRSFAKTGGNRQIADKLPKIAIIWSDRTSRVVTVFHDHGGQVARRYSARN